MIRPTRQLKEAHILRLAYASNRYDSLERIIFWMVVLRDIFKLTICHQRVIGCGQPENITVTQSVEFVDQPDKHFGAASFRLKTPVKTTGVPNFIIAAPYRWYFNATNATAARIPAMMPHEKGSRWKARKQPPNSSVAVAATKPQCK